jgi:ribosomal protein S18 acetylase RimI-like enzyme
VTITVRNARPGDEETVAQLIRELAVSFAETSEVSAAFVAKYLATPDVGALLAEQDGVAVGLLTYSLYCGLYHAGPWGLLDELVVRKEARRQGVGDELLNEVVRRFQAAGCKEASVSLAFENEAARALYRKHAFTDEALLLERHFER